MMEFRIEYSENLINLKENFIIKVISNQDNIKTFSEFPEIENFVKVGIQKSSSMKVLNGKVVEEYCLNQYYMPKNLGVSKLSSFKIKINDFYIDGPTISLYVENTFEKGQVILKEKNITDKEEKIQNEKLVELNPPEKNKLLRDKMHVAYLLIIISSISIAVFINFFFILEDSDKFYYNISGLILLFFFLSVIFHLFYNRGEINRKKIIQLVLIFIVYFGLVFLLPENKEFTKSYKKTSKPFKIDYGKYRK